MVALFLLGGNWSVETRQIIMIIGLYGTPCQD